jgi:hypothetical protein
LEDIEQEMNEEAHGGQFSPATPASRASLGG